jgi:membrane protease YdiL (CAAX protease family)
MQTTSSPTSSRRSSGRSRKGLIAWLTLATILVVLGFAGQSSGESNPDLFYDYGLALSSLLIYGILVGITFWAGTAYGDPLKELGLNVFSVKWTAIAVGLIFLVLGLSFFLEPILHAGEEQGYAPDVWRPERARAFFVNGLVAATFVPFAEELFFRGLGVRALTFLGSVVAILGTALAFGLGHGILVALPIFVAFGAALAWVRLRSDSVWPGIVAHGLFNALALVAVYADLTN